VCRAPIITNSARHRHAWLDTKMACAINRHYAERSPPPARHYL